MEIHSFEHYLSLFLTAVFIETWRSPFFSECVRSWLSPRASRRRSDWRSLLPSFRELPSPPIIYSTNFSCRPEPFHDAWLPIRDSRFVLLSFISYIGVIAAIVQTGTSLDRFFQLSTTRWGFSCLDYRQLRDSSWIAFHGSALVRLW